MSRNLHPHMQRKSTSWLTTHAVRYLTRDRRMTSPQCYNTISTFFYSTTSLHYNWPFKVPCLYISTWVIFYRTHRCRHPTYFHMKGTWHFPDWKIGTNITVFTMFTNLKDFLRLGQCHFRNGVSHIHTIHGYGVCCVWICSWHRRLKMLVKHCISSTFMFRSINVTSEYALQLLYIFWYLSHAIIQC